VDDKQLTAIMFRSKDIVIIVVDAAKQPQWVGTIFAVFDFPDCASYKL
jgi:hypothetical protein